MLPHRLVVCLICLFLFGHESIFAQKRKPPTGGRLAVVVEEQARAASRDAATRRKTRPAAESRTTGRYPVSDDHV